MRQMSLFISLHHFPPLYSTDDSLPDPRNSQGRDFHNKLEKIISTKSLFIRLCIRLRRLSFLELCACNWILERKTNIFFSQKICSICSATLTNVKGGNLNKKVGLVGSCHNFFLQKSKRKKRLTLLSLPRENHFRCKGPSNLLMSEMNHVFAWQTKE